MNETKTSSTRRLYVLGAFLLCVLAAYVGVMYNTQITNGSYYREQSVRTITNTETVEASRGILTDRNGKVIVSNRQTYALTFDASLLNDEDDENQAILRLIQLCRQRGVLWNDNLPVSKSPPFLYTVDTGGSIQRNRFVKFLQQSLSALSTNVKSESVNNELLNSITSSSALMKTMREFFEIPGDWSESDARAVIGVRYELEVRKIINTTAYVFADDVNTELISLVKDGNYRGVKVSSSSVREYNTPAAAHILGSVGRINEEELAAHEGLYNGEDWIGKSGVELAFESHLRGTDGTRLVSTNSDGKITSEIYTTEPKPGNTVALSIDLDLQSATEEALAKTISTMNAKDGNSTRGAGAAMIEVGTGEVLALASYPTFDLSSYSKDYNVLSSTPSHPLFNRATQGMYAPGSTFKPCTAVAALESGVINTQTRVRDTGRYNYPGTDFYLRCWIYPGSHGLINVTQALTVSCNYFFCEMGYRLGIDRLDQFASAFGLGQKTGIEIGDAAGVLAGPAYSESIGQTWYGGNTVQAAIGQSDHLFTPLQLSNYIATLVSGGKHYSAHLLKSVKSYDNSVVVHSETPEPLNTMSISNSTLSSVKAGMHDLTTKGSLAGYFKKCIVDAGAKTGTTQISKETKNNGVFVCFAPYDDPQVALAIVIEKGGSGSALASTAVEILNAYFAKEEIGTVIVGENQLLP